MIDEGQIVLLVCCTIALLCMIAIGIIKNIKNIKAEDDAHAKLVLEAQWEAYELMPEPRPPWCKPSRSRLP